MRRLKEWCLKKAKEVKNLLYQWYNFYIVYPHISKKFRFQVMTNDETVDAVRKDRLSVSRYGDGEFFLMRMRSIGFQEADEQLAKRLKEVLHSRENGHLNCITDMMLSTDGLLRHSAIYCRSYVAGNFEKLKQDIPENRTYGCSNFTRFYADWADKDKVVMQKKVNSIRALWEGMRVYLIEGEYTRCGIGNDLLDNAKSVHRIICPATNAFAKYAEILETACRNIPTEDNVIILCLLGPTATVLAYDLFKAGYQAIDMGHIDIEYEWFKRGVPYKSRVAGKAVNERGGNYPDNPITTVEYERQIIEKVL